MAAPNPHSISERLERGEVVHYPAAPFPLPEGIEHAVLLDLKIAPFSKNISYDPATDKAHGFLQTNPVQGEAVRSIFSRFSRDGTAWLSRALPRYVPTLKPAAATGRKRRPRAACALRRGTT